jgi:hypothetical protein
VLTITLAYAAATATAHNPALVFAGAAGLMHRAGLAAVAAGWNCSSTSSVSRWSSWTPASSMRRFVPKVRPWAGQRQPRAGRTVPAVGPAGRTARTFEGVVRQVHGRDRRRGRPPGATGRAASGAGLR